MNNRLLTAGLTAVIATSGGATVNDVDARGYLERGEEMYRTLNFQGCLDQLNHLSLLNPTAEEAEESLYFTAMAMQGLGDDEALTVLRRFLTTYPASPRRQDVLMSIGDYYFNRSAYSDALKAYRDVDPTALDESREEDYRYRTAYCYMLLGEYTLAEQLFEQLTGTAAYGNAATYYIAWIAYARHDYDRALELFGKVDTSTEPGNAAPYYMAQIYFVKGDYTRSLALAREMLERGSMPQFAGECNRLAGESLYSMGDEDAALPYLWKYAASTAEPQPSAYYILGLSEYRSGNIDNAIKLLQRAIGENDAMSQSAYLTLGQAYQRRGDSDAALMAFERAYTMDADRAVTETAFYNYAVARSTGGRVPFGSSVLILEEFLDRYPRSKYAPDVRKFIIRGYMTDNDYDSALSSINRVSDPDDAVLEAKQTVLFMLGTRNYTAGNYQTALKYLDEAAALSQYDRSIATQTQMWRADCNYRLGNYAEAADGYLAFLRATPANDTEARRLAWYDLGYARLGQERWADALDDFNRVIADSRGMSAEMLADSYNRAGDAQYYMSQFGAAAANYRKALETNPRAGDYAQFQLAMMQGFNRDYSGKIESIDRLLNDYPSSGLVAQALLEKADTYVAMGNNSKGIDTYNALIANYANTSQARNALLRLAVTHLNNGDRATALATYRKVVSTYPSSEEARLATDDLKRLYAADGKLDELMAFMAGVQGAPTIDPSEVDALTFNAAEAEYINSGDTRKIEAYLASYPTGIHAATALYYLAEDAWNDGDNQRAIKTADRLLATYPDAEAAEDVLSIKAEAQSMLGKKEASLATWLQLEERASGASLKQHARLGAMLMADELGRDEQALALADKILSSTAASPEVVDRVKFHRGRALNRLHRYNDAEKAWEELTAHPEELYGARSIIEMATSLYDRGKPARAKTLVNKLISSNTPQQYWLARGFILYSDILRSEGKEFEADEYLRSLKSNYPGKEADIFTMINQRLKK